LPVLVGGLLALGVVLSTGCSSSAEQSKKADYKKAESLSALEVPPDLTAPESRGGVEIPGVDDPRGAQTDAAQEATGDLAQESVLPEQTGVEIRRAGDMRWLVVEAPPEEVWAAVSRFWEENGFELQMEAPRIGIMETAWAENRADIEEGFVRGLISKVFTNAYSADTRDKFRVRLERGADGQGTELFLTHYGIREVVVEDTAPTVWEPRPSDPELAAEMLNRLMLHLGVDEAKEQSPEARVVEAPAPPRAHLAHDQVGAYLLVEENFARAWRRTGVALDRIGLVVEDRDRSRGVYYVRQVDLVEDAGKRGEKGWFGSLFSSEDDGSEAGDKGGRMRLQLQATDGRVRVELQDAEGARDGSSRAEEILGRLQQELQ